MLTSYQPLFTGVWGYISDIKNKAFLIESCCLFAYTVNPIRFFCMDYYNSPKARDSKALVIWNVKLAYKDKNAHNF